MTWLFQYHKSLIFEKWKNYRIDLLNVAGFGIRTITYNVLFYSSHAIAWFCFVHVILFAICMSRTLQCAHVMGLCCCTYWPLEGRAVLRIDHRFPKDVPQLNVMASFQEHHSNCQLRPSNSGGGTMGTFYRTWHLIGCQDDFFQICNGSEQK